MLCWWAAYHIKLGVDTIYLYVHDASVVEPKKKALEKRRRRLYY